MGLLEKAGKIQTEEADPPVEPDAPDTVVLPDPEPVKEEPTKKAKKRRGSKKKKEKKVRVAKVMPEGFEAATRGQSFLRRFVDFLVSYGWSVPLFAINARCT